MAETTLATECAEPITCGKAQVRKHSAAAPKRKRVFEGGEILDTAIMGHVGGVVTRSYYTRKIEEQQAKKRLAVSFLESEEFPTAINDLEEFRTPTNAPIRQLSCPVYLRQSPSSDFSDEPAIFSITSHMLLSYKKEFVQTTTNSQGFVEEQNDNDSFLLEEDLEDGENYALLRRREKKHYSNYNGAEGGEIGEEYKEMVSKERLRMVKWMIKSAEENTFETQTLYVGVSLLDQVLCKGYFKSKRTMQLLGLACCTLALKLEECRSFSSSILDRTHFNVGKKYFAKREVVAMESMVQELLKFQFCMPTIYNFLRLYAKPKVKGTECELLNSVNRLAIKLLKKQGRLLFWPSTTAAALVILASQKKEDNERVDRVTKMHTTTTKFNNLVDCVQSLEWLFKH